MEVDNHPSIITAEDYLEHATEINEVARQLLNLDTRDATWLQGKISIGLSLQAAELAGKCMLRGLGCTVEEIRTQHRQHDILELLRSVQTKLGECQDHELAKHRRLLLRTPTINGKDFGTTIGAYLEKHFSNGPSAKPRSYFYPDEESFTGPVPIHALLVMVDDLIEIAREITHYTDAFEGRNEGNS